MGKCLPSSTSGIFLTVLFIFLIKFLRVKDFSRTKLLACGVFRAVENELVIVFDLLTCGLFVCTGVLLKLLKFILRVVRLIVGGESTRLSC